MSQAYVADCSQVMAFLLGEDEGELMESIVRQTAEKNEVLNAPGLLHVEVSNVLTIAHRKNRITEQDRVEILEDYFLLPIRCEDTGDKSVYKRIGEYAKEYDLTAHDASYLELALRLNAQLLTLDQDLLKLRAVYPKIFL